MLKISPSVLNADYLTLANEIKILEAAGVDMLHLDVMDGIFVPNISFGVPVIQSIKKHTHLPLDVHLMIDRPHRYIEQFAKVADILGFHYEAGSNVANTLREIRALGVKNCLTIKPQTPAEAIAAVRYGSNYVGRAGLWRAKFYAKLFKKSRSVAAAGRQAGAEF